MRTGRDARARASRRVIAALAALSLVLTGAPAGPAGVAASDRVPQVLVAANVFHPQQPVLDHLVLIVDTVIDPTSIPGPDDFLVHLDGASAAPLAATLVYAGLAGPGSALGVTGASFIRLDIDPIPVGQIGSWSYPDFRVDYVPDPDGPRIRDRALNDAPAASVEIALFEAVGMELPAATIDHEYGADKLLLFLAQPIAAGPTPDGSDFLITIDGDTFSPVSTAVVLDDLGVGILELRLPAPITAVEGQARVVYTPGANRVAGRYDGAQLIGFDIDWVYFFLPANNLTVTLGPGGGTASTASGAGVSVSDPVATTVHSPTGGTVSISEQPLEGTPPTGYVFFGQLVEITAPDATDPADPLVFTFDLHSSLVPSGESSQTIEVLRNGVPVPDCAPPASVTPVADPAPCVWARADQPNGDAAITIATLQASRWNLALRAPVAFDGFFAPVDNRSRNGVRAGSAIPLRFSLGGDRGLDVFANGSPSSRPVACDTQEPYDDVETTVTAGTSSLAYVAASDTYTYVWKTSVSWTGCRQLSMTFLDGTTVQTTFQFRR